MLGRRLFKVSAAARDINKKSGNAAEHGGNQNNRAKIPTFNPCAILESDCPKQAAQANTGVLLNFSATTTASKKRDGLIDN